jgi:hypothetical protein
MIVLPVAIISAVADALMFTNARIVHAFRSRVAVLQNVASLQNRLAVFAVAAIVLDAVTFVQMLFDVEFARRLFVTIRHQVAGDLFAWNAVESGVPIVAANAGTSTTDAESGRHRIVRVQLKNAERVRQTGLHLLIRQTLTVQTTVGIADALVGDRFTVQSVARVTMATHTTRHLRTMFDHRFERLLQMIHRMRLIARQRYTVGVLMTIVQQSTIGRV